MNQNLNKKIEFKEKAIDLFKKNKFKFLIPFFILIILFTVYQIINISNKKQNIFLSEIYVKAEILLAEDKREESQKYLEKIIKDGNNFYSLLALNMILENNLVSDKNKILNYFNNIENKKFSNELKDLILFKKALYLIKTGDNELGIKILSKLTQKESKLKILAQEIISK